MSPEKDEKSPKCKQQIYIFSTKPTVFHKTTQKSVQSSSGNSHHKQPSKFAPLAASKFTAQIES